MSWCINILGENSNEWYFRNGSFKLYDWIDGEWNFELNIQWSVFKNEDLEDGACGNGMWFSLINILIYEKRLEKSSILYIYIYI